jgi:hypothetical protein
VRYNHAGKLYTLVYDKLVAREVNPIEKKPLLAHGLTPEQAVDVIIMGLLR